MHYPYSVPRLTCKSGAYLGLFCAHAYAHTDTNKTILHEMLKGIDMAIWETFSALGLGIMVRPVSKWHTSAFLPFLLGRSGNLENTFSCGTDAKDFYLFLLSWTEACFTDHTIVEDEVDPYDDDADEDSFDDEADVGSYDNDGDTDSYHDEPEPGKIRLIGTRIRSIYYGGSKEFGQEPLDGFADEALKMANVQWLTEPGSLEPQVNFVAVSDSFFLASIHSFLFIYTVAECPKLCPSLGR